MHTTKKISCLRQEVALDRYEVDAHDIAEAMLRRLAPVNWGPIPAIADVVEAEVPSTRPGAGTAAVLCRLRRPGVVRTPRR